MARDKLRKHSRLSPSCTDRWIHCPGSAMHNLPEKPANKKSDEGDVLHERVSLLLKTGDPLLPEDDPRVHSYISFVRCLSKRKTLAVEQELQSLAIPDLFGTPDALVLGKNSLYIVDFKTGAWGVKARNNGQLKTYLMLGRENYGDFSTYLGAIVQKFPDHAEFSERSLDQHAEKVVEAANSPSLFVAGEHCLWCPLLYYRKCRLGVGYATKRHWWTQYKKYFASAPETPPNST